MTIEEIYELMSKGFDKIDQRFDKVDEKFDKVDERFDKVDERLRNVETDIAELKGRKSAFMTVKDWVIAISAVSAVIISLLAYFKGG